MNEERIFNLFIYFNNGVANKAGVRFHKKGGDDAEKIEFLKAHVDVDQIKAKLFDLSRSFTPEQWRAQLRLGGPLGHFENLLKEMRAPQNLIFGLTAIVDGSAKVDQVIGSEPFRGSDVTEFQREGKMSDYLNDYTDGEIFLFSKLIDDDYFKAIKLLFKEGHYVSAAKLLMSCIDTLAFVDIGDTRNNFQIWIDKYCNLEQVGITSAELWEFRNSILHMTNLSSRAVLKGSQSRITPFVGPLDYVAPLEAGDGKPFNLLGLIQNVSMGIQTWGQTYISDQDKILLFIERYDTTISDARFAIKTIDKVSNEIG